MEWKSLIEVEIQKGFSKSTIEKLAGLSKNNLASALSGNRELSKVGKIKIERWLASEKPDPLTLIVPKKKEMDKITNLAKETPLGKKVMEQIKNTPSTLTVRNISPTGVVLSTHNLQQPIVNEKAIKERIEVLNKEIAKSPANLSIPKKVYINIREREIKELEAKLK